MRRQSDQAKNLSILLGTLEKKCQDRGQLQVGAGLFRDMTEWERDRLKVISKGAIWIICHIAFCSSSERTQACENKSMTVWDSQTVIYLSGKRQFVMRRNSFAPEWQTPLLGFRQLLTQTGPIRKKESKEFTEVNYKSSKPDKQNKTSAPVRVWKIISSVSVTKKVIFGNWKSEQHKIVALQQARRDVQKSWWLMGWFTETLAHFTRSLAASFTDCCSTGGLAAVCAALPMINSRVLEP